MGGTRRRQISARTILLIAGMMPALGVASTANAQMQRADNPLTRDSFPIGSNEGALCQVQSALADPAIDGMFDRVWTI